MKEFEEFKFLEIDQPEMNHNGGTILFGPPQEDSRGIGYLYYGVGDGGGFGDLHGERIDPSDKNSVLGNAQNLETHLGKILRIDVNVKFDFISKITGKPYLIPLGNPSEIRERIVTSQQRKMIIFPVILREIYAYGLRNPWKFSFDKNGRLFIADVGQHKIEEVNLIKSGSLLRNYGPNPLNFGWRALEGGVTLKDINVFNNKVLERIGGYENTIPPILEYDRTKFKEKESAIIGGYMYDGFEIPTLKDKYVFGDFNGKIFYSFEIVIDPTKSKWIMDELIFKDKHELKGLSQDIENIENDRIRIPSFAIDFMGELYVFKINTTKKPGSLGKAGLYKFVSFDLTKEEIDSIFENTEKVASKTTSGIRNKSNGVATCKMHISIYTLSGYLKTYSMEDAWIGSVDISRSKAFTATAFSSNENALTSRTIGELSQTGPWNASKDEPFDKNRPPLYGIETSNPQYGITSFPGGIPIYKNEKLVGGLGVSGDTVDNDEKVAFEGLSEKFQPPENITIDTVNDETCSFRIDIGPETFWHYTTIGDGSTVNTVAAGLSADINTTSTIAVANAVGPVITIICNVTPGQYVITASTDGTGGLTWVETQTYSPAGTTYNDYSIAFKDTVAGDERIYANMLYLHFQIDNIPSNVESWQIVRVLRTSTDRTVVAQGMIGPITVAGSDAYHDKWDLATGWNTDNLYSFQSPEVSFNKNLTRQSNDRLQEVAVFGDTPAPVAGVSRDTTAKPNVYKYQNLIALTNPQRTIAGASSGDEFHPTSKTEILEGFIVRQDEIEAGIGSFTYTTNNSTLNTDKGIAFILEAENASWRVRNTAYDDRTLVNYRRNIFNTQYGGNTWSARRRNIYSSASEIIDESVGTTFVYGGDSFIGMFDYIYSSWEDEIVPTTPIPQVLYFPVETSINVDLRQDDCYHRVYNDPIAALIHDTTGIWTDGSDKYVQNTDQYYYNTVYSKENDAKLFIAKPFDWSVQTIFDTRTYASQVKTNNELADSWLRFGVNAYIDVDSQYGSITGLKKLNNKLLFFQPHAFGVLSVNERALFESGTVSQLSLGKSGILDRFDYAKTEIGLTQREHMFLTPNALYWLDFHNRSMIKFTGGPEEVSLMKGMDSWFRANILNETDMLMWYDPKWKEVCLSDSADVWTLAYNELTASFTSFLGVTARFSINYDDQTFTTNDRQNFRRANDIAEKRGYLDGAYHKSDITLLINPDESNIGIFNNFNWLIEVNLESDGSDLRETFNEITLWNDYQHSGVKTLVVGTNVKRRMRKWRLKIPRAIFKIDGTTTLKQNDRTTAQRDARFRDSYLLAKFSWTNASTSKKIVVHDIITSFTQSNK
ncbi:hypothetical protein LCGC14_1299880 [marine sediment metagenome]|uniref:Uncharacterized protein n=1 Tax=marine sediment metagenome TaxID=412755 RepID=A0A0F9KRJ6_9ZZZZ